MILFKYRASGFPPEHPECSRIFTEHGRKLCAPRHCDTSTGKHERMGPWPQAAQGHTPIHHLDPPLKNGPYVESSLWDWLVSAVILHQGGITWTSSSTVLGAH